MLLVIDSMGRAQCLYSEALDLAQLGPLRIQRASHVEPDRKGRWWADLAPVSGPRLGPFRQRSTALHVEQCWLEAHQLRGRLTPMGGSAIQYELRTHLQGEEDVCFALERMRQAALKLPFKEVGDLLELTGKAVGPEAADRCRWLKLQAECHLHLMGLDVRVAPLHVIGFETWPGEGCEPANFGLCRYPASVEVEVDGRRRLLPTGLSGWRWQSWCQTQFAGDPVCGGMANLRQCHDLVIQLLDVFARSGWFEVTVMDPNGGGEHRNSEAVASVLGHSHRLAATG